ncbi:MAG: Uma2 family endonuclease [Propionivibrio sp.]
MNHLVQPTCRQSNTRVGTRRRQAAARNIRTCHLPEFKVEKVPSYPSSEVIEGVWYGVQKRSNAQQAMCRRLELILRAHLQCSLEQIFVPSDNHPLCTLTSTLLPDFWVSTLSPEPSKELRVAYPGLVIIVLSPQREKVERGAKLKALRSIRSVKEILVIDTTRQCGEHYRRIDERDWAIEDFGKNDLVHLKSIHLCFSPFSD